MGCDGATAVTYATYDMFQSTHPHGVRLCPCQHHHLEQGFNPRTRMGCDLLYQTHLTIIYHSFNPRTRMGCDPVFKSINTPAIVGFNPRTRMGCDTIQERAIESKEWFQSTHPHGVRHAVKVNERYGYPKFQSTHPHGVRPI